MFGELLGEAERDIIEECTDINVRFVPGKEQSSTWTVEDTGIALFLPPDCVPSGTVLSCHVSCDSQVPLDFGETLISRVISLEVDSSVVKEDFTIAIPHSGSKRYEFGSCYENVVKEFCQESETWKDADLSTFENVEKQSVYMVYRYKKRLHPEIVKLPAILLKRRCGGTFCVISRLRTETIPVGPSGGRLWSTGHPDVTVTVEKNTFMESANLSLKVVPLPHNSYFHYGWDITLGPVIILSVKSKQDVKMLNPIVVSVYHPMFTMEVWKRIRILYKKTDAPDGEWIDATDDIPFTVSRNGDIDMHINHLSMFWPVRVLENLVGTEKVIETATSLFSKLYGKSPVRAYFDVRERENSQVGRKTILDIEVMPWHLTPQLKSNSEEDPFDKEHIMVELRRDGSVTPYNENHQSPFTIRFDSQCRKSKGMHVDLHGNKKCIRSNCYFKSMFGRKSLLCDYPFTLSMDIEKIQPREFCGIPFDESERSYLILLETPCDVLFDCKSNTENQDFKVVIEDTIEKEKKTSERESLKYFYQEISHKDFEQDAFDGLVSSMNDHPGLDHIKSMLSKGRKMVMQPVDKESINCIVHSAKEDYNAFAIALGLENKCRDIEWEHYGSKDRFIALVHAWRSRDKEKATLHVLMKTLLDISCEDGVNDLVQRYKQLLETSNSPRQDQVIGYLREDMQSSEAIVESASEDETDHSTDHSPLQEERPPRVEECDDSETHSRKAIGTIFEQRSQLRRGGDVNGRDRVIAIPMGYIVSSLVLIVAIVIYKYFL